MDLAQSHILKFVIKGRPIRTDIGVKCNPEQTYGLSQQSPDQFKGKHSLTGKNGYIYRHQESPEFDHFSQKKYYSIDGTGAQNFTELYYDKKGRNPIAFHRKKGRLTEFMEKNAWMAKVIPIMGFERSPQARQLQMRDRRNRITSLKSKKVYDNKFFNKAKPDPNYHETISGMMSEKVRIRRQRNQLAELQVPASARATFSATIENHQRDFVQYNMAKTAKDWAANSTKTTFYKPHSQSQRKPTRGTITSQVSKRNQAPIMIDQYNTIQAIDKFNRTTCTTKWTYKKCPKLDTDESPEEALFN